MACLVTGKVGGQQEVVPIMDPCKDFIVSSPILDENTGLCWSKFGFG